MQRSESGLARSIDTGTHVPVPHERTREKTGPPPPTDYSLLMCVHRLVSCSALVLLLIELLPDVCCCE